MSRQCLECESFNDDDALHCDQCGNSLDGPSPATMGLPGDRSIQIAQMMVLAILMGLVWWGIQQAPTDVSSGDEDRPGTARSADSGAGSAGTDATPGPGDDFLLNDQDLPGSRTGGATGLLWGWVQVTDPGGRTLSQLPAAVTSGGWLALPRVALLGAAEVSFREGKPGQGTVSSGRFRRSAASTRLGSGHEQIGQQ